MITNKLPGSKSPYKLEAGEGQRYCFGTQLAIVIARPEDLGHPMAGVVLSGASGSSFPLHRHAATHEAWFILEGMISVVLGDKEYTVTPGSYINIPPGTAHGYTFQDHRSKFVAWTFGGNANELYAAIGSPYDGTVYPDQGQAVDWGRLTAAVDTEVLTRSETKPGKALTALPAGREPFVLGPWEGERMLAAEQLYTFQGTQAHSDNLFISLLTEGPIGPEIPRHFHDTVTETFFCLHGALEMFVNDGYLTLEPGDFLHIPPGAIHSFKLMRNDTRFIGFLSPGNFEAFFRYLCQPYDGHIYPLVPPPFRFDRVLQHMGELDLHLLGRPGGPPPSGAA
jgi:quercetin 2,3-dioxygenase